MRTKAEQILLEVENLKTVERNYYLNGSETAKGIWADLERHTKHLKTILKAGDFDDISEREIPALIDKIKSKKSDWQALINIEKAREINSAASPKELTNTKNRIAIEMGTQRAAMRAAAEERSVYGASGTLGDWFEINRSTIESFCATTFVVVLIQLALNVYFINKVKVTTQFSIIEPLEQQLHMTETKNIQMAKRLSDMKKEISLYRTLMKNMPIATPKTKTSKVEFDTLESLGLAVPDNRDLVSLVKDSDWAE